MIRIHSSTELRNLTNSMWDKCKRTHTQIHHGQTVDEDKVKILKVVREKQLLRYKGTRCRKWLTTEAKRQQTFFFFLLFLRAAPAAYGDSQARGQMRATAASLHHSHSNARSKPCLQPTSQLMTMLDPYMYMYLYFHTNNVS